LEKALCPDYKRYFEFREEHHCPGELKVMCLFNEYLNVSKTFNAGSVYLLRLARGLNVL
jgi:hypothetical protein